MVGHSEYSAGLVAGEAGVAADFADLGEVAFGVGGEENGPLVDVHVAESEVGLVPVAEIFFRELNEVDGALAGFVEFGADFTEGGPAAGGADFLGGVDLAAAIGDGAVDHLFFAADGVALGGGRGSVLHLLLEEVEDEGLGGGDVLGDFNDGPLVGGALVLGLGVGESVGLEGEGFAGALEIVDGVLPFFGGLS